MGSSRTPRRSLTSPWKTTRSHPQSSGRKVPTLQRITQEVATKQRERPASAASIRCLKGTKIPANSSVDTPGPTTGMPGTEGLLITRHCARLCCRLIGGIAVVFLLRQAFHRTPAHLQPQPQQAFVGAAVPSVSGRPAESVPSGPDHRRRADGRGHREGPAEQEGRRQAAQTDGDFRSAHHTVTHQRAFFFFFLHISEKNVFLTHLLPSS